MLKCLPRPKVSRNHTQRTRWYAQHVRPLIVAENEMQAAQQIALSRKHPLPDHPEASCNWDKGLELGSSEAWHKCM